MSSNLDTGKASRVLDLLETATRRGDLDKDEAVSILSSWLADQKRHSSGNGCLHSSWPACTASPATSPVEPPPLPPRSWFSDAQCQQEQQQEEQQQQQQQQQLMLQTSKQRCKQKRSPGWFQLLASCVVPKEAATQQQLAEPQHAPQLEPEYPDHEYALYGAVQSEATVSSGTMDVEDDYEASYYTEEPQGATAGRKQRLLVEEATESNTVDSGVSNC
ncbi:hypothetical protein BOX15_Mlig031924g4 [Macrostomum lignano]|uniref:Uncharacterized protein n=1 Tax=Macrostomum lignano TaxID=282301 RepID=A0A267GF45_9PLAT|nr:hypothetical protein BOX15_Mlig031924g4 [Macrostomum lignano]